jgi:NAD(P)H-hydrate epimerase
MGVAVLADLTVTFVGQKTGLFLADGREHCGVLLFDAIGIPQDVADGFEPEIRLFTSRDLARVLPTRGRAAHKGDFGHVAVVGGNHGMGGAVRLAGEAALRCGAGLVTVLTRPENIAAVTGYCPELMCQGVESAADFRAAIRRATVIAVGPGLGQDDWARLMLEQVSRSTLATVADADALNLLAEAPARKPGWIITPHPGEAATLLGCSTVEVQRARVDAARALAEKFDCTAVLKGSGTLVVGPGSTPWLIRQGNPGMASAGMGDVLTGITAGMVAQAGSDAAGRVAAAAAFVHACAGDSAASAGERGIIASELFVHLRPWLNP